MATATTGHERLEREPRAVDRSDAVPVARLAAYLRAIGLELDVGVGIKQFSGGLANLNYLIYVNSIPVVLRRPPLGPLPKGAHDMVREFSILSNLSRALPFIPMGIHLCVDVNVLGAPFQLLEYREGIVIRGASNAFPGREAELSVMMVETLAALHAVDPDSVGLGGLGRPEGFVSRSIQGWCNRGLGVVERAQDRSLIEEIRGWLSKQSVRQGTAALLHCDFKLDNCILDPVSLRPNAVIDWDMGTRGPRLFDLATTLSYWAQPGDPPCMFELAQMPTAKPGFMSREQVLARYAQETGCDISDYYVYRVLAMLKLGVVFLQLHRRWLDGGLGDERYAKFRDLGTQILEYNRSVMLGRSI